MAHRRQWAITWRPCPFIRPQSNTTNEGFHMLLARLVVLSPSSYFHQRGYKHAIQRDRKNVNRSKSDSAGNSVASVIISNQPITWRGKKIDIKKYIQGNNINLIELFDRWVFLSRHSHTNSTDRIELIELKAVTTQQRPKAPTLSTNLCNDPTNHLFENFSI